MTDLQIMAVVVIWSVMCSTLASAFAYHRGWNKGFKECEEIDKSINEWRDK